MTAFDRLQPAIADVLKVPRESITEATRAQDVPAWDSLGHVNLMMTLEQTFDLLLDVDDFARLNSIPAMIEYLKQRGIE